MRTPAWAIVLLVLLGFLLLYCVVKLYTATKSLDDLIIVLIEQTWTLQLLMLKTYGGKELAVNWSDDALSIPGPKGELLIRRFSLIKQWAAAFKGVHTETQSQIEHRLQEIDAELINYHVNLKQITNLTLKMIYDLYNGDFASSSNITMSIIQKLRVLR